MGLVLSGLLASLLHLLFRAFTASLVLDTDCHRIREKKARTGYESDEDTVVKSWRKGKISYRAVFQSTKIAMHGSNCVIFLLDRSMGC